MECVCGVYGWCVVDVGVVCGCSVKCEDGCEGGRRQCALQEMHTHCLRCAHMQV